MSQNQSVTRGKRPRVQVSLQEKERAIERIRNGETKAGISRELGVPESTVRGWVKRAEQRLSKEVDCTQSSAQKSKATRQRSVAVAKPAVAAVAPAPAQAQAPAQAPAPTQAQIGKNNNSNNNNKLGKGPSRDGGSIEAPMSEPTLLASPPPLPSISAYAGVALTASSSSDETMDGRARILSWLRIFNAGLLNFTLIASAASLQSRLRGNSQRYLWELISSYIDEHGSLHCAQLGVATLSAEFDMGQALIELARDDRRLPRQRACSSIGTGTGSVAHTTRVRAISSRSSGSRAVCVPPPFHVTAPDDDSPMEVDDDDNV